MNNNSSYPTKAEFNNCFIIHSKYFRRPTKSWSTHQLNSIYTVTSLGFVYISSMIVAKFKIKEKLSLGLCLQVDTSSLRLPVCMEHRISRCYKGYIFFLSFNPNSDFSQFASAVNRYNIFGYHENKKIMWWSSFVRIIPNSKNQSR